MKCILFAVSLGLLAPVVRAEPSITNVLVRQQWPWRTDVHIDYDVTGVDASAPQDVVVTAYDGETPLGELPTAALNGSRYSITKDGRYRIVFDPTKSGLAAHGNMTQFNVALSLTASTPNSEIIYKVVDFKTGDVTDISRAELLAGKYGAVETTFKHGTSTLENVLIWTGVTNDVAYKTTKMVFRKIPAGTFTMGSATGGDRPDREVPHEVTLTRDFYLGVFKVTRAQWLNFMDRPPYGQNDAADYLAYTNGAYRLYGACSMTYYGLRGDYSIDPSAGDWPRTGNRVSADSFLGRIRAALPVEGYEFDLPTDAQWEYAARAGTTGRYYYTSYSGANPIYPQAGRDVGLAIPNAFGLYDVMASSSCGEIVLDYSSVAPAETASAPVTDPQGVLSADKAYPDWPRTLRGSRDHIASRNFITVWGGDYYGVRIALHPEGWWINE